MTTELHLTSIDMTDFSKDGVQVFVEALYSAQTSNISRSTFRDVNKMAHVFQVTWLVTECEKVFSKIADLAGPCWPDLLFLFEEAAFIKFMRNSDKLKEIALKRIHALHWEQDFIKYYDENNNDIPAYKLDMIIELAGSQVHYILLPINRYLTEIHLGKKSRELLPKKYKYLLENTDLSLYKLSTSRKHLFESIFDRLRDVPIKTDDHSDWLLRIYRDANVPCQISSPECRKIPARSRQASEVSQGDKSVPQTY